MQENRNEKPPKKKGQTHENLPQGKKKKKEKRRKTMF